MNEDVAAYNLFKHAHTPEMREAVSHMAGGASASVVFYAAPGADDARHPGHVLRARRGLDRRGAARRARVLRRSAFVRVTEHSPHSKWAQGTNLAFVSYAADPDGER